MVFSLLLVSIFSSQTNIFLRKLKFHISTFHSKSKPMTMSDVASSNGKKKNKKADKNLANSSSNDILSSALPSSRSLNSRIGPRTYKVVILGEGGVGKSGEISTQFHKKSKVRPAGPRIYIVYPNKKTIW